MKIIEFLLGCFVHLIENKNIKQHRLTIAMTLKTTINFSKTKYLLVFVSLLFSHLTLAKNLSLNTNQLYWKNLRYNASKFFVSFNAKVQYQLLTKAQANLSLKDKNKTDKINWQTTNVNPQITLETDVLGIHSTINLLMNEQSKALQRTSLSTGRKNYYHQLNYGTKNISSIKSRPKDKKEKHLNYTQWSNKNEKTYPLSANDKVLPLTETEAIFYLISAAKLEKTGDHYTSYIYDKNGTIQLNFDAEAMTKLKVKYRAHFNKKTKRIKTKINVLRIRVSASRYHDAKQNSHFSFLGYKGDIDLYIDVKKRIILQIKGKIDYVGTVSIKLKEVDCTNKLCFE